VAPRPHPRLTGWSAAQPAEQFAHAGARNSQKLGPSPRGAVDDGKPASQQIDIAARLDPIAALRHE
jgi:hypothetical protein